MKLKSMLLIAVGSLTLGVAGAMAGEKEYDEAKWNEKFEAKFSEIDTNSDGVVSEAEYVAMKEAEARKHFAKISGEDGELTLAEAKEAAKKKHYKKKRHKKEKKSES